MRTAKTLLLGGLAWGFPSGAFALLWPFDDQTTPPAIGTTFGDWNAERLHDGIDIPKPVGTPVKAIEDGYVAWIDDSDPDGSIVIVPNSGDRIGWHYAHVTDFAVDAGTRVTKGTIIGHVTDFQPGQAQEIDAFDHMHLERADFVGPISEPDHPFNFFSPSELPTQQAILPANKIFFAPDQTFDTGRFPTSPLGTKVIFGNVDVVAEAHTRIGGLESPGAYNLSFAVTAPPIGAASIPRRTLAKFDRFPLYQEFDKIFLLYALPPHAPSLPFGQPPSTLHHGHYVLTNCGPFPPPAHDGTFNVIENAWFTRIAPKLISLASDRR